MDPFAALGSARAELRSRLELIRPVHRNLQTPCPEWTVGELCNHVVGGGARYTMLLDQRPTAEIEATRTVDFLQPNPVDAFDRIEASLDRVLAQPGALERVVHHRYGDVTALVLVYYRTIDCAVHGWDIARAIGADERLPITLLEEVERLLVHVDGSPGFRSPDAGPAACATLQERVLHRCGRETPLGDGDLNSI